MPLIPISQPQPVPIRSGFDYVTVDAQRRRVYAAHTASQALTIVDADTGKVTGQVRVGPLHGIAVDPENGHVFTGNGTDNSVSEVDPVTKTVLRSANVAGAVDAIAYDPSNGHIYADEDDGTHIFVVDAKTMKNVGTVDLPGHKPEYLAVDPKTHDVYQNIANLSEYVIVDGASLKVKKTIATPDVTGNHPLQFDAAHGHVLIGGTNATIVAYDATGKLIGKTTVQKTVDQCSLDQHSHLLACAGSGMLTLLRDNPSGAPTIVSQLPAERGAHTVGIDEKTGNVWLVWAQATGDFVQAFSTKS